MTEHPPPPDDLAARQQFYSSLSDLQEEVLTPAATCGPDLRALLVRAAEYGFCWVDTGSELIVAHIGGHQIAFREEVDATTGQAVCWALGLPMSLIPERATAEPPAPAAEADAEPEAAAPDPEPVAEEEEEEEEAAAPDPEPEASGRAATDPLTESERGAALAMVKGMNADQRKSFTLAFRHAFSVPREEKAIAPLITQWQHLQFVDRFTGEAAGVVVP